MNKFFMLDAAANSAGASGNDMWIMLAVYAVFIVALYFIFFRPQSKKKKK